MKDVDGQYAKYKVIHCDGALKSLDEALNSVTDSKKLSLELGLKALIIRRARGERLSENTFVKEASITNNLNFYAIKKLPIRVYLWTENGTIYISHYIKKDKKKLNSKDIERVRRNRAKLFK